MLGDVKRLSLSLRRLQLENQQALISLGYDPASVLHLSNTSYLGPHSLMMHYYGSQRNEVSFIRSNYVVPLLNCIKLT